ncbi:WD40-repeat-containing domain protein [Crucibulum laeve]|uniref:WD40-repeat-containing domain protein n=1 Tax=Crucibulum laeve TaxID=68775 RepID=A0A5C3M1C6_9AGAR|nr:WD40-repeat-containing domain protein [Crucibulum laeve]
MAKHPRKKQKIAVTEVQLLGSSALELLLDEASKDDEERRLEAMLFGTKYVPRGDAKKAKGIIDMEEGDEGIEDGAGKEMQHLLDTDLFYMDDGLPSAPIANLNVEIPSEGDGSIPQEDEEGSQSEEEDEPAEPTTQPTNPLLSRKTKAPAWTDPSDRASDAKVSLLSGPSLLRKLRVTPTEDTISGKEYETRLRRQFERVNPEPTWAKNARKVRAGKKVSAGSDEEDDHEDNEEVVDLLSSTGGILARKGHAGKKSIVLPAGSLAIERLRDANQSSQASGSGEVKVVAFHPSENVPVLCVATADRRVRLFNVDGHTSPLLTTLHVPSLPLISQTSVSFHPQGSSLLLTGPRPFYFTYDLQTGATIKHARGLWGTTFSSVNDGSSSVNRKRGHNQKSDGGGGGGESLSLTAFSPNTGSMVAVAGRSGNVHLVDWTSGAGQVVATLKCGGGGGGIQGLWWVPPSSENAVLGGGGGAGVDGAKLAVLSGDAEVYLWDVGERRCVRRWKDDGGFRGASCVMAGTTKGASGGYLAVGSNTGLVNVYGSDSFATSYTSDADATFSSGNKPPRPLKTLGNLTTAISTLRFNHDAQIIAMASKEKKDSMRLVHLPSLTAFSNWPTSSTPLGHVTAVDFSAKSEYVAIGNTRGRVLLYHLREYGAGYGMRY